MRPVTTRERDAVQHFTLCGVPAINIAATLDRSPGMVQSWRAKLGLQNIEREQVKTSSLVFSRPTFCTLSTYAAARRLKITRLVSIIAESVVRRGQLDELVQLKPLPPDARATLHVPARPRPAPSFSVQVAV
jgi:hypothetical protein